MQELAYIDAADDPELLLAWEQLRQRVVDLSGWQYHGSRREDELWFHFFKNRKLIEQSESEEDRDSAVQEIAASATWLPTQG